MLTEVITTSLHHLIWNIIFMDTYSACSFTSSFHYSWTELWWKIEILCRSTALQVKPIVHQSTPWIAASGCLLGSAHLVYTESVLLMTSTDGDSTHNDKFRILNCQYLPGASNHKLPPVLPNRFDWSAGSNGSTHRLARSQSLCENSENSDHVTFG